jgi:DNA gyrase subunit A
VTQKGMGKRTSLEDYRKQRRGGKGVINIKTSPKTGKVVAMKRVEPGDELMLITRRGIVNRQGVDAIRVIGRNTQGVRLVNLDPGDQLVDVGCVANEDRIGEEQHVASSTGELDAADQAALEAVADADEVIE